mmetsp:Transcript_44775/g.97026  ORF Transcript_44775/g.97026 Transcript_44775/m.97026 type:complete len:130 (+) Transcript_44775:2-391(+)
MAQQPELAGDLTVTAATVHNLDKISGTDIAGTWGVVIETPDGSFLLYPSRQEPFAVAPVAKMSEKWNRVGELSVQAGKTFGGCQEACPKVTGFAVAGVQNTRYKSAAEGLSSYTLCGGIARLTEYLEKA